MVKAQHSFVMELFGKRSIRQTYTTSDNMSLHLLLGTKENDCFVFLIDSS